MLLRQERGSWIVGRKDGGDFVELPDEALTFIRALQDGEPIHQAGVRVTQEHGQEIDVPDFIEALLDLEFVASIDDQQVSSQHPPPSLPWLRPWHVRWVFHGPVYTCIAVLIVAGLAIAFEHRRVIPGYGAFFITHSPSINVAWGGAMFLSTMAIHEFWHLSAARSEDIHARIGLGTRLHFLVAQTTVSGLWGAPRSIRIRVYLAGMTSDLVIFTMCSLVMNNCDPAGFTFRSLDALRLGLLLAMATQFELYMRTDMYFVLQELLGCRNLYADAWRYFRYICAKVLTVFSGTEHQSDPTLELPNHERRPIKIYSVVMVVGSSTTISLFAFYGAPILLTLFAQSIENVAQGLTTRNAARMADGLTVIGIEGGTQVLFLRIFIKKHLPKIMRLFTAGVSNSRA